MGQVLPPKPMDPNTVCGKGAQVGGEKQRNYHCTKSAMDYDVVLQSALFASLGIHLASKRNDKIVKMLEEKTLPRQQMKIIRDTGRVHQIKAGVGDTPAVPSVISLPLYFLKPHVVHAMIEQGVGGKFQGGFEGLVGVGAAPHDD